MQLTAYRCSKCGHYTISSSDGISCVKCHGTVVPSGNATIREKSKALNIDVSLDVSLKDTEIFKTIMDKRKNSKTCP